MVILQVSLAQTQKLCLEHKQKAHVRRDTGQGVEWR